MPCQIRHTKEPGSMGSFTFPGNLIDVDYPAFLSQHDVVYLAPVPDGIDGLPIGNGDLGAMIWTPPDHLRLAINKVDLWDDGPDGPFSSWGEQDEEVSTMLRAAGSLTIGHGLPTFDRLYLTDFAARLRLAEAAVECRATTPFDAVDAQAFASEAAQVLVVRYRDQTEEPLPRRIEAARWGTRSLLHWYRRIRRDDPLALQGTEVGVAGRQLWITQRLRQLHFAVAVGVDGPAAPRRLHRRAGVFESEPVTAFAATIYVAVVTSEEADDPLATAIERVERAARRGFDALVEEHRASWRRFWEASLVDLPPAQDYVENLWCLSSYYLASACRGRYPPNHINAVYGWNRDVLPWAHYYHWNEQMHVWPVHASGHGELALPHLRWRRGMLPHAIEDARRVHDRAGAFYCDVCNRKGYQAAHPGDDLSGNLTPGPQIALQFWQHYSYTRDEAFLCDEAYPVIREVTRFYLETVQRREDGRYTFIGTQPYESVVWLREPLTDLAHARRLFQVFLEASERLQIDEGELGDRCREVLAALADFVTRPVATESAVAPDSIMDLRPVRFKELQPGDPTMPIWFLGYKVAGGWSGRADQAPDGTPVHEGMSDPATGWWVFTSTNMAPVFPTGLVGLDQAGAADFDTAVNTVRALGYDNQGFSLWMVAKARLGLADLLAESLERWPQSFQIGPQGFTHWALANHPDRAKAPDSRSLTEIGVVGSPDEKISWPLALSWHLSIEALPILQLAINEMLLQSYTGTIRVFPAVTEGWEGRFRLHAVGRFVVSAERAGGRTRYAVIESRGGEPCRVANPWPGCPVALYRQVEGWSPVRTLAGAVFSFETAMGAVYLLVPAETDPASLTPATITGVANQGVKTLGSSRLGMPKGI
jgi:hypothetical protein